MSLRNIDENYPFSLSPKLILALLISVGICVIAIGIIFIWYKRKTSLTCSMVGNLIKLVPSLNEKIPTLNSLFPILSEQTPSQNNENVITPVSVSRLSHTPPDELFLQPVMVTKLHMETEKPSTSTNILLCLEPSPVHSTDIATGPLSLEMFNCVTTDLNGKGVINLKKIQQVSKQEIQTHIMAYAVDEKMSKTFFVKLLTEKANIIKEHFKNRQSDLIICANIGHIMAAFKLYDRKEEDSLKLHATLSNLGRHRSTITSAVVTSELCVKTILCTLSKLKCQKSSLKKIIKHIYI